MQSRRSRAPVDLLPIFRSAAQFQLLGELFLDPDREWSLAELAEQIGALPSSVSREVKRLEGAGLVRSRRRANARLVSAAMGTTIAEDLRRLLVKTYGPAPVVRDTLSEVDGIEQAFIFGSWAARAAGQPGPPANDIDVLVIGDVEPLAVYEAARIATKRLGMEVNPVIRTAAEWEHDETQFAATVKAGPTMDVTGDRHG